MKASTERLLIRWTHLLLSIPILGFIYGPVAEIPRAAFATRWVFMPVVIFSGLWLWKGHLVKKFFRPAVAENKSNSKPQRLSVGRSWFSQIRKPN